MTDASRSPVPIIDIGPFLAGDRGGQDAVADQVAAACEDIGFLVITGHGVPTSSIDDIYRVTQRFFALPLTKKMNVASAALDPFEGYGPMKLPVPVAGQTDRPDLREMFHSSRYDTPDEAVQFGYPSEVASSMPRNIWPAQPADFEAVWRRYYVEMEALAGRLLHIFAVALGLREDWFDDKVDRHLSNLAANCYPEQHTSPVPGQLRSHAHVDFSTLTILYQDGAPGGLQVFHRTLGWRDVPAVPYSYVVNLGDMMARWTNDRWVATLHRVINPPAQHALTRRISIPYFHMPNHDVVIEAIPTCVSEMKPARYRPVEAGEWVAARRKGRPADYARIAS